jgi:hypothetical protein
MVDGRLAEIFAREVLGFLVRQELLSQEWAERILSWQHLLRKREEVRAISGRGPRAETAFLGGWSRKGNSYLSSFRNKDSPAGEAGGRSRFIPSPLT